MNRVELWKHFLRVKKLRDAKTTFKRAIALEESAIVACGMASDLEGANDHRTAIENLTKEWNTDLKTYRKRKRK